MKLDTCEAELALLTQEVESLKEKVCELNLRKKKHQDELRELQDLQHLLKITKEERLEVRRQITVLMQEEQAAKEKAANESAKDHEISTQGTLLEGELYVDVVLQYGNKTLFANLLLDTGANMTLNIREFKTDQLGLPDEGEIVEVQMGQDKRGHLKRRAPVLVKLRLKSDDDQVLEDRFRKASMDVWTDVGSRDVIRSPRDTTTPGEALVIIADANISPIKKGVDSRGHDAILGAQGMGLLGLGIDRVAGRLYIKKISLRKLTAC